MHRYKVKGKRRMRLKIQKSKRLLSALVIAFALLFFTFNFSLAATAEAKHYTELQLAPLAEIKLPKYERFVLQNGLVVYLMEDHELPLVNGTALVRTGSRLEPSEKVGLAGFTGAVMRTGGTKKHSPDQLNDMLEQRAAAVETSIGEANGNASFQALSEDLETVFGLFTEVLREPVFAQEKLDLAKTQARGSIARRNDDPDEIASREFRKLIYGKENPYARTIEYVTLDRVSREDLLNFYQQYFHPNNLILGIVGDFDSKKMRSLIQAKLGDWKRNPKIVKPQLPEVLPANTGGVFFVNQPQLTQSSILVGHLGGRFDNPDYAALDVLNGVLNGFGGRLFNEVRSRQGLAYSVYGYWSPRFDYPGMFIAGGQTRSDATVQFVKALQAEIKRIQAQRVTPKELAFAKESTLNSFVFNFQDPSQTLLRLMRYEYYGYPADFLFRYQKAVAATTAIDVQRVAKQYLKPENIVTLVVGNQSAIQPPLTQLAAQVTPIDVAIPTSQPQMKN
ncbi:insulinase family protein [Komarekiella sp. 'clone 1']|uniref:Insulinase family protein n=1 Tax=Komarekiella delphini-convector SJRDD-AB1 TaxID=2593771 RepID=A0AA40SSI2_9NOST|nr:pitrilysin family protein [Komarekiella delphini-convector]MBD6614449.1 insulinase family protein [Komarekiella delphini-convector SJRDD-AB1]